MPYRKISLVEGEIYHVFTKSIAGFKIFNSAKSFHRIIDTIAFYALENTPCKFSLWLKAQGQPNSKPALEFRGSPEKIVKILTYCIMPTHIHLILQQMKKNGISRYVNLVLKSYSKYFNEKLKRKGPLWEGRFKSVLVESDEQFLHLTRYIHLNPVTAFLVDDPKDWEFSSYREYVGLIDEAKKVCNFSKYLDMDVASYKKFVNDRINYQRELDKIKHLTLE